MQGQSWETPGGRSGMMKSQQKNAAAQIIQFCFTLVELLIVIAIIAALASMLLPALSKAKDYAKSSVCKGNLRQTGSAAAVYMGDNDGMLPYLGGLSGSGHEQDWGVYWWRKYPNWLNSLLIMMDRRPGWDDPAGTDASPSEWGKGIFYCPSKTAAVYSGYWYGGYTWNQYIAGEYPGVNCNKLESVGNPSKKILGADTADNAGWYVFKFNYSDANCYPSRHGMRGNYLRCDMHVDDQLRAEAFSDKANQFFK
jgi:type II secretory pathway pseudopilin PulG